jgi:hypothetical protein
VCCEKARKEIDWAEALKEQRKRRSAAEKYAESFYPWQKFLLEEIEKVADDRTIWLVLDKNGATGKSQYQRILADKYPGKVLMIPDDNKRDILNLASNHKKYKFVFMNVARQTKKIDLPQCNYKAYREYNLKRHVKSIHENLCYHCDLCSYTTTRTNYLKAHIKVFHNNPSKSQTFFQIQKNVRQ